MMNSDTMHGMPSSKTQMMYMMMYEAPPFSPAMYGKRQTLPRPTADPAVASIIPNVFLKFALSDIINLVDG